MENLPMEAPAHIQALIAANANLVKFQNDFIAGLGGGTFPPYIGTKQTRFTTVVDGESTVLDVTYIDAIIMRGKETLNKTYYAKAFDAKAEAEAPDCYSLDGIKPEVDSRNKQCESCAGCPQNQFGTSRKQDGTLGTGKACRDTKILAIFANKGIYGFKVTPDSLKGFKAYVAELSKRNIPLFSVITRIAFDPNNDTPRLTFNHVGFLNEVQLGAIYEKLDCEEVHAIIEPKAQIQITQKPAAPQGPSAEELKAKEAEEKAAKAAEAKAKKEAKAKEDAAKAAAQTPATDLGLGDLLGTTETPVVVAPTSPDDKALADALGL